MQRIIAFFMTILMFLFPRLNVPKTEFDKETWTTDYTYVFVHGLSGWGEYAFYYDQLLRLFREGVVAPRGGVGAALRRVAALARRRSRGGRRGPGLGMVHGGDYSSLRALPQAADLETGVVDPEVVVVELDGVGPFAAHDGGEFEEEPRVAVRLRGELELVQSGDVRPGGPRQVQDDLERPAAEALDGLQLQRPVASLDAEPPPNALRNAAACAQERRRLRPFEQGRAPGARAGRVAGGVAD